MLLTITKKVKHFTDLNVTTVLEVAKKKGPYGPYLGIKKRIPVTDVGLNHLTRNRLTYFM